MRWAGRRTDRGTGVTCLVALAVCPLPLTTARPLVLVSGVQKAGTSALASYLHLAYPGQLVFPRVECQTGSYNETRFFVPLVSPCTVEEMLHGEHPEQCGLEAYMHCWEADSRNRALEKSPDYLFWPHVPRILAPWLGHPLTRIVALLRDPTDRFVSDAAQSFLSRIHWVAPEDHPGLLFGLIRHALHFAKPLLEVAYRNGGAPDTRDWAKLWRVALRGTCESESSEDWEAKGKLFFGGVLRPAFNRAKRARRRMTTTWERYESLLIADAALPRPHEKRCWACASDAFNLCYLSQLFLQGMYLPQLVSWMEVLGGLGEALGLRLRIVQSEALWNQPAEQLGLLAQWMGLVDPDASVPFLRDASVSAKWHLEGSNSSWALILNPLRNAYRRPTRQLLLWLDEHPGLTNAPFDAYAWRSVS